MPRPGKKNSNETLEVDLENLEYFLNVALEECDYDERRRSDPVSIVHGWDDPEDQEIAALVVSSLAYGRVGLLKEAARDTLARMGGSPRAFVEDVAPEDYPAVFSGFVYRMTRGRDLADLVAGIARVVRRHGSLEAAYAAHQGSHLERASGLVNAIRTGRLRAELARGLRYALVDPLDGSTAKRIHLFFRWLVRGPGPVDLGLWGAASPDELIMPLDTHTSRICRYLGLTQRKSRDLKTALEVTETLRRLDPEDPLKYDFALCHLGISGSCIHRRSDEHCPACPIEPVCTLE